MEKNIDLIQLHTLKLDVNNLNKETLDYLYRNKINKTNTYSNTKFVTENGI